MSTANKTRTITELFTTVTNKYCIALFFLGEFVCNCDNWKEVEEEKYKIIGY